MLEDGTYEVVVVDIGDADDPDELDGRPGPRRVEVTVIAGPHKGEVVALTATGLDGDLLDLLAAPGTVEVRGGVPHLRLDD